jgi:hypothetical protein
LKGQEDGTDRIHRRSSGAFRTPVTLTAAVRDGKRCQSCRPNKVRREKPKQRQKEQFQDDLRLLIFDQQRVICGRPSQLPEVKYYIAPCNCSKRKRLFAIERPMETLTGFSITQSYTVLVFVM